MTTNETVIQESQVVNNEKETEKSDDEDVSLFLSILLLIGALTGLAVLLFILIAPLMLGGYLGIQHATDDIMVSSVLETLVHDKCGIFKSIEITDIDVKDWLWTKEARRGTFVLKNSVGQTCKVEFNVLGSILTKTEVSLSPLQVMKMSTFQYIQHDKE